MFFKIGILKNFAISTFVVVTLFLIKLVNKVNKVNDFIKKETPTQMFCCEYCEIFKNSSFYRTPTVAASVRDFLMKTFVEFEKIFCTEVTTRPLHVQS